MNPDQSPESIPDYTQPVAYDAEGRPLYAHPPRQQAAQPQVSEQPVQTQPVVPAEPRVMTQTAAQQVVHVARSVEPIKQQVSDELKKRHDTSVKDFPTLNLSDNEYIISAVRRHPIGLFVPMFSGILLIVIALSIALNYSAIIDALGITIGLPDPAVVIIPLLLLCLFVGFGLFVAYYVYVNNKFFLTNESVIQEIQLSLFSKHEQTVSLGNIEDASYYKRGILQYIFDYGSIRLSTQGDETTYRFTYVASPKRHIATLNNAVESFKNGRPFGD